MILLNTQMRKYSQPNQVQPEILGKEPEFQQLGKAIFFKRIINENIHLVVNHYSGDDSFDWSGYEYSQNKIHLNDLFEGQLHEIIPSGIHLIQKLAKVFSKTHPAVPSVFWLACDDAGPIPSAAFGFYLKREGFPSILPEEDSSISEFPSPLMVILMP